MSNRLSSPGLRYGAAASLLMLAGLLAGPGSALAADRVVLVEHWTATW